MNLEREEIFEKTKRNEGLEFYQSRKSGGIPLLSYTPQNADELRTQTIASIPRHKVNAVYMARYYCRTLQERGVITLAETYNVMYTICDRYALYLTMSTNYWEYNPATIDRYERLAQGFLQLANEAKTQQR